jgi:release factor glutamine methyltransferase
VLRRSTAYLAERGAPAARLDADLLLAHALGIDRLRLYTDSERPLTPAELARARELLARRGRREPLAYVTGERAFRRLRLAVGPGVLVPRPETEVLVEWALEVAPPGGTALDWGTGSGAIALALADEGRSLRVTALDRAPAALERARANAAATPAASSAFLAATA